MKFEQKIKIGKTELKNRLAMSPMISNIANPDGTTNDNHINYLSERARGGFGLIITEYTYIDQINAKGSPNELGLFHILQVPKLSRLTDSIHKNGSKVFVQLVHAGGKANPDLNPEVPMAPSRVSYGHFHPREMTLDDINNVVEEFIKSAKLAKQANFDGVELHGAHAYLLSEFISPYLNKRTDRYGGSLENRLRIINEISSSIKDSLDITLGIRLSLYEDEQDGYNSDYGLRVGESISNIDYVHYSAGRFEPPGSSASFYSNHAHIYGKYTRKINKPVILVGSATNINDVEKMLEMADVVSVGRGALADAYFPHSILGNLNRPCIRCNQACRNLALSEVRCSVNPDLGYETYIKHEKYHGNIPIKGAGIKGLEAAFYAHRLGFNVSIYENNNVGGQMNEIYDEYKRRDFFTLIDYYKRVIDRSGIKIIQDDAPENAINCLPDKTYPDLEIKDISIDSNVFKYHDLALKIAETNKVKMSLRSLDSLDRSRKEPYMKVAKKLGIEFIEEGGFDFSLYDGDQYDIRKAMLSGRNAIDRFITEKFQGEFY